MLTQWHNINFLFIHSKTLEWFTYFRFFDQNYISENAESIVDDELFGKREFFDKRIRDSLPFSEECKKRGWKRYEKFK